MIGHKSFREHYDDYSVLFELEVRRHQEQLSPEERWRYGALQQHHFDLGPMDLLAVALLMGNRPILTAKVFYYTAKNPEFRGV